MPKAKRRRSKKPRLYQVDNGLGATLHCVSWYIDGKRKKKHFASLTQAKEKFNEVKLAEENQTLNWQSLSEAERIEILQAAKLAKGLNVTLADAVRGAIKQGGPGKPIGAKEAGSKYVAHLKAIGVKQINKPRAAVNQFYDHFGDIEMDTLDRTAIQEWVASSKVWKAPRTKNGKLNELATWWRFLKREGLEVGHTNPFASPTPDANTKGIVRHKDPKKRVDILTLEEVEKVLEEAFTCPTVVAVIVLCLFCGVRIEEACQLSWADIDLDDEDPTIDVGPEVAKSFKNGATSERYIHLSPYQAQWVKAAKAAGGVLPVSLNSYQKAKTGNRYYEAHTYRRTDRGGKLSKRNIKEVPGAVPTLKGRQNVLRHSFCSYHVCAFEDIGKTSHVAGNSPGIIKRNYFERIKRKVALKFWELKLPC